MAKQITDETLAEYLQSLPNDVQALNLRNNLISVKSVALLQDLIQKSKVLQFLDLSNNELDADAAAALSFALQMNNSIKTFKLAGNKIGGKGGLQIASALQINTVLTSLDMADTDLTLESVIAFTTVLSSNNTLTDINLDRPLLRSVQEETASHVGRMLVMNQTIQSISLRKHAFGEFGVARIFEGLQRNTSLLSIDLSCNKLSRDAATTIAKSLSPPITLTTLMLAHNAIDDEGAAALALAIPKSKLECVGLQHNAICGHGIDAIAFTLTKCPRLVRISLWGNPALCGSAINADVCTRLAGALQSRGDTLQCDLRPYVVDGKHLFAEA